MKDKFEKVEGFMERHGDDITAYGILVGMMFIAYVSGKKSVRENIQCKSSYIDGDGNVVKEIYQKRVK